MRSRVTSSRKEKRGKTLSQRDSKTKSVEGYLPHRPPFLFVSGIENPYDGEEGRCYLDLTPGDYPYLEDGVFPHMLVLEALGQSVATLQAHHLASTGLKKTEKGYLVKLNDILFEGSARMGDRVILAIRLKGKLGMLVLFKGEARVGERRICSGEMTFFRETDD